MNNRFRLGFLHILLMMCCLLAVVSFMGNDGRETVQANVLLYWPTDEGDPNYKEWTEIVRRELRRQGIEGHIEVHYAHSTERYESIERPMFSELIRRLRAEGKMPDLILSYGDINRWLMTTVTDPLICSIPLVCYGLYLDDYLQSQYDLLLNDYNGGRWEMVDIIADLNVEENLTMTNAFAEDIFDYIRRPDDRAMSKNRVVTLLDVEYLWCDRVRYLQIRNRMEKMDPERFYDNFSPTGTYGSTAAVKAGKTVFSCRSLLSPDWNADSGPTTWVFYPQKSSNVYLQTKHDNKARSLVEGPSFSPFCTAIAEEYLVNDKCIGGCFPTAESQIRDAVSAGLRLLKGESALQIGPLRHESTYNINWDVVRPFGLDVNKVPAGVHLDNVTFEDRNPVKARSIRMVIRVCIIILLFVGLCLIALFARRYHRNTVRLHRYANDAINRQAILNQMMDVIDFRVWDDRGSTDLSPARISTTPFFEEKLAGFRAITEPGHYSIQIYASIDGKESHWYMIMMTVGFNPETGAMRRGVIVNYDNHKKLEALAAETNRVLTLARAREGFIASMNHEIRTPLNSIVGYTQLLTMSGKEIEEDELKEYADVIRSNDYMLKTTINNILTASRIDNTDMTPELGIIDIQEYIVARKESRKSVDSLSGHRIVIEPGPSGLKVKADADMLDVVLENLVVNAAKFSGEDTDISVGWDSCGEDGAVEIWVKDRGIGIAPEYHCHIFDSFFKVDSFSSGCGLGLYITRKYVELMGGEITVASTPGEGSVFRIRLAS